MKKAICYILFIVVLSLCDSNAFAQRDTNSHEIPWKFIQDTDIVWRKRVWREVDVYEKQNAPLRDDPESPHENVFANMLLSGINSGLYKAYMPDISHNEQSSRNTDHDELTDKWIISDTSLPDTYLKNPLSKEEVNRIIACDPAKLSISSIMYLNFYAQHKNDTMEFLIDKPFTKKKKKIRAWEKAISIYDTTSVISCVYPQQIDHYGIVEDWIFDKGQELMVVRIVAIAPIVQRKPLFWLSYPDIRRYLAQYEAYDGRKNTHLNWDEYFVSRQFSSRITKIGK